MDSYYALHLPAGAIYSAYTYYQIYVNAGATLVYKGITLPSPSGGPIVLNLTVNSDTDISGSSGIALLGKKKPEAFATGPAGQGGVNTDGTWNIRG
jgi:hypothetical protein